jgi:hypothetical protein
MDAFDSFYQEMDSRELLDRHGRELVVEAREMLARTPMARLCGLIATADSRDAEALRDMIRRLTGQPVPAGLMQCLLPRETIEAVLTAHVPPEHWREEEWQPQQVLAVMVSMRDGMRFGFFPLAEAAPPGD